MALFEFDDGPGQFVQGTDVTMTFMENGIQFTLSIKNLYSDRYTNEQKARYAPDMGTGTTQGHLIISDWYAVGRCSPASTWKLTRTSLSSRRVWPAKPTSTIRAARPS